MRQSIMMAFTPPQVDDDGKKALSEHSKEQSGEGSDTNGFARFDNLTLEVTSAVPEPSSAFLIGLAGLCLMRRRR